MRQNQISVQQRCSAFTLVELITVIAIIAVLIGLILPAVVSMREAANAVSCRNNLRQIGIALLQYHETSRQFPAGSRYVPEYPAAKGPFYGNWSIYILPFIEQNQVYILENDQLPNLDQSEAFRTRQVSTYICPSDPNPHSPAVPGSTGPAFVAQLQYSPSNYRANTGLNDGVNRNFDRPDGTYWLIKNGKLAWRGPFGATNPFASVEPVRIVQILDGTSNTLLVGETTRTTGLEQRAFWNYSFFEWWGSSVPVVVDPAGGKTSPPQPRVLLADYDQCTNTRPYYEGPCKRGWSSVHGGVINFAFCDGSVHIISSTVDMQILATLSTMAGSEVNSWIGD